MKKKVLHFMFIFLLIGIYIYPFSVYSIENDNVEEVVEQQEETETPEEPTSQEDEEPPTDEETEIINPEIEYKTHVQNIGW